MRASAMDVGELARVASSYSRFDRDLCRNFGNQYLTM
jgi:hypothetical protein